MEIGGLVRIPDLAHALGDVVDDVAGRVLDRLSDVGDEVGDALLDGGVVLQLGECRFETLIRRRSGSDLLVEDLGRDVDAAGGEEQERDDGHDAFSREEGISGIRSGDMKYHSCPYRVEQENEVVPLSSAKTCARVAL